MFLESFLFIHRQKGRAHFTPVDQVVSLFRPPFQALADYHKETHYPPSEEVADFCKAWSKYRAATE